MVLIAAKWVLRGLNVANMLCAAAFLALIGASCVLHARFAAILHAKYGAAFDAGAVMGLLRMVLLTGVVAAVPVWLIFVALLRLVATVEAGDPFAAANGQRLQTIAWAMLALQLLDVALGVLGGWIGRFGFEWVGWSPSVSGWLCVPMLFLLARVFAHGARMRDELEMTV